MLWKTLDSEGVFRRGMPLWHRLELLKEHDYGDTLSGTPSRYASDLVERWQQRAEEVNDGTFSRILNVYQLDTTQLVRLVDLPSHKSFTWSIDDLIPELNNKGNSHNWEYSYSFPRLCDPLIAPFINKLRGVLYEMHLKYPHILGHDTEKLLKIFVPALESRVQRLVHKTCILELNVARLRKLLKGETSEERFEDFIRLLGTETFQHKLLSEYSVISYYAVTFAHQWLRVAENLVKRLCLDYKVCATELLGGKNPGTLESISWSEGDLHNRGQSICVLKFSSGEKLVYKPHSLAINFAFEKFLDRINTLPLSPRLRYSPVLNFGNYGWQKFAINEPCVDDRQIERFYWRQGIFTSIFYLLDTYDLHNENLIASSEFPIYVDCETLIHPVKETPYTKNHSPLPTPRLVSSLDLLPHHVWGSEDSKGVDLSGMGGAPGQKLPFAVQKRMPLEQTKCG